ncbi:MAG TPA: efflux RND transporter permease subunit [Mycobacteriales bacterium]|jgi:RND superfamily putative drug exporter|nr:efflux RND transporter permease subunit [Mycobacteriales bacterium]
MFDRLAGLILRKPRAVLLVTLLLVLAAGAASSGLNSRVTLGGYEKEGSESQRTTQVLQDKFDQGDPNLVLLVTDERGVDSPAAQAAGLALTQRLAGEADLSNVVSYWSAGRAEQLRSQDSSKALVTATIEGDFDAVLDRIKTLAPAYSGDFQGARVQVGGSAMTWDENIKTSAEDISRAEAIVFPLVLVVLVLIFGSLLAALVPLAVAFVTMLLAMLLMFLLTLFTEPSSFVTNITVFLGLGLAIDYSLLMVSRYREELRRGRAMPDAIRAMLRTSGRTVVFSAVTVAVALGALLVFPFTIFDSMAYASIATALLAAVASLVVVPALLAWMGPRIDKWRLFHRKDRSEQRLESGFWHRLAMFVMRRPVPVAVVVIAVLLLLGAPALGLKLRLPDEQILPKDAQAAQVATAVRTEFASREQDAVQVVAEGVGDPAARSADITAYAQRLSGLPNVARVDALTGTFARGQQVAPAGEASRRFATQDATFLTVIPTVDGYSQEGEDLVRAVRDTERPFPVTVGGTPAVSVDTFDAIYDTLPVFLVVLAVGMFILLFLLTGSLLLPVMAMALSLLSLTATFGALVFIFQDGNLQSVVGDFNVTGAITWTVPILVFALGFGLSMDYQVFLLSRIREEYERSGDNTASVAVGIERVGRVVTYAAALISIVFLVWITSGISYMKAIGVGMPIAILMDATLIRGALLPALMRLAGDANWSAPGPLRRLHARLGLREHAEPAPNEAAVPERTSAEVR